MQHVITHRPRPECPPGRHRRQWVGRSRWLQLFRQLEGIDYPFEDELGGSRVWVCRTCRTLGRVQVLDLVPPPITA